MRFTEMNCRFHSDWAELPLRTGGGSARRSATLRREYWNAIAVGSAKYLHVLTLSVRIPLAPTEKSPSQPEVVPTPKMSQMNLCSLAICANRKWHNF